MRATIKDVAQKAGYSTATVSIVLNNKQNVSIPASTRKVILDAARELNYRPNQLAVSMLTRKTGLLGLIIPDNSNLFFAELSKAVEAAAREKGYILIYSNSNNDPKRDMEYMQMLLDRQVEGIILAKSAPEAGRDDARERKFLQDAPVPVVTLDRQIEGENIKSVLLDHYRGGYLAAHHLIEKGHTRVGCYTGPHTLTSSQQRLAGVRYAFTMAGLPFDDALVYEGNYQRGGAKKALQHFLNHDATAVFCFNDLMAYDMYDEARKCGLTIPRHISIIGFDNLFFDDIIHPPLTSVNQPVDEMGRCAVDVLLGLVEKREMPSQLQYVFQPHVVERASCAQLKGR